VGLRYERASSPDPQRLVALARAAAQAGYLWLSHRVASRAGVDLVNIVRELGLEAQGHLPPSVLHNRVAPATRVNMPTQPTLDVSGTIALNYVLEFLHNMQRSVLEDQRFLPAQVVEIAQCLLKSVPMHTDATEAQVAEALKTAARRLGAIGPATAERDGEERNTSKPDSMRLAG
jgi:hypothetical protein